MRSKSGRNSGNVTATPAVEDGGNGASQQGRNGGGSAVSHNGGSAYMIDGREILRVLTAFRRGDFSVRMAPDQIGMAGKIADTLNDIIDLNDRMANEFERMNRVVGKDGKISQRANIGITPGSWAACVESVNGLVSDLVQPLTEVGRVIGAVARGDLSQTMNQDAEGRPLKGEFLRTSRLVNTMVEQLNSFASEVTRVAREVGTEGKLGGQ